VEITCVEQQQHYVKRFVFTVLLSAVGNGVRRFLATLPESFGLIELRIFCVVQFRQYLFIILNRTLSTHKKNKSIKQ